MNVKTQICTLANSHLGRADVINDIDSPASPAEKAYAKWFDTSRDYCLKVLMPNFALGRAIAPQLASSPEFGWAYAYQKPTNCLKVLGIGEVQDKENNFAVEGDSILCDEDYSDGMKVRFVKRITDVAKYSPEFIKLMAWDLAYEACMEITKDLEKLAYIEKKMPSMLLTASALSGQENRPIRINNSKFKLARTSLYPSTEIKR